MLISILSTPEEEGIIRVSCKSIQSRSCGFHRKEDYASANRIPDHLPKLSPKQISKTLNDLEAIGMYARFRLGLGNRGGVTYYSVKHSPEGIAEKVCPKVNRRRKSRVAAEQLRDLHLCQDLLN